MDTKGNNKLKMYKTVKTVIISNGIVWNGIPAFVTIVDRYDGKVILLDQLVFEQETGLIGVRKLKDKERIQTAELANSIASALRVYATDNNDTVLLEKMNFMPSEMSFKGSLATLQIIQRVELAALEHASELGDYGISETMINNLVEQHDHLITAFGSTRDAIVQRGKNTKLIKGLIKEIDELLKMGLDQLVEVVKHTAPEFAIAYYQAREVVDQHGKKHKPTNSDAPEEEV